MFHVELRQGGLIEARIQSLRDLAEAKVYGQSFLQIIRDNPNKRLVLCADHRPVVVYSQPVSDELATIFGNMNSKFTRVAIIVAPTNATLGMQLDRIVREAKNPSRRVFRDAAGTEEFLAEVLDGAEIRRMREFLGEIAEPVSR